MYFPMHPEFSVPPDPIRDDACELIDDTVCASDLACYFAGPKGETQCVPPGTAGIGDACEISSDCVPGAGCHGTPKLCYELCEVLPTDEMSTCPSGLRCDWLNLAGHHSVGVCNEPP